MYKTESFVKISDYDAFKDYRNWLQNIQQTHRIEIVSTTNLNGILIVTYKEL